MWLLYLCGTGSKLPENCQMNRQLQTRLTGALLLVTLAVIFLPMIFTADGLTPITPQVAVRIDLDDDPRPNAELLTTQGQEKWQFWQRSEQLRQNLEHSTQVQDFLLPDAGVAVKRGASTDASSSNLDDTAYDDDGVPVAWAVQVGSFNNKVNAVKLKETLDNNSYLKGEGHGSTLARQLNDNGETMYRVAVGPFLDRRTAEKVKQVLEHDTVELEAVIQRFSMVGDR